MQHLLSKTTNTLYFICLFCAVFSFVQDCFLTQSSCQATNEDSRKLLLPARSSLAHYTCKTAHCHFFSLWFLYGLNKCKDVLITAAVWNKLAVAVKLFKFVRKFGDAWV